MESDFWTTLVRRRILNLKPHSDQQNRPTNATKMPNDSEMVSEGETYLERGNERDLLIGNANKQHSNLMFSKISLPSLNSALLPMLDGKIRFIGFWIQYSIGGMPNCMVDAPMPHWTMDIQRKFVE